MKIIKENHISLKFYYNTIMKELKEFWNLASKTVEKACNILYEQTKKPIEFYEKEPSHYVTDHDKMIQNLIIDMIKENFSDHKIIGEEEDKHLKTSDTGVYWIIDPIDGTNNFIHQFPFFAVSLACMVDGQIVIGIVQNPVTGDRYWARKNIGAFLNKQRINVSKTNSINYGMIAMSVARHGSNYIDMGALAKVLWNTAQATRTMGSAALETCQVASGRFDAFLSSKVKIWDNAAANLIVTEAGGTVTNLVGEEYQFNDEVLVTNGLLHPYFIDLINNYKHNNK